MNKLKEDYKEHTNSEKRKVRRPDQCLYQPPGGRHQRTDVGKDSNVLKKSARECLPEGSRESPRHGIARSKVGQEKNLSSCRGSTSIYESKKEEDDPRCKNISKFYNNENKRPHISNESSSRRESDEFKRVFEPFLSGKYESLIEEQGPDSARKTGRALQREREMKTKNRSLQARKNKKNINSDEDEDDDDENNAWKSFDRSKIKGSMPQTPTREFYGNKHFKNKLQYGMKPDFLPPGRTNVGSINFGCEGVEKDLVFIDVEEEKESKPNLSNDHHLWNPTHNDTSKSTRGLIKLPAKNSINPAIFKPPEPRPRKAVDPEFIRRPVIREHSKYIALPNNDQCVPENKTFQNVVLNLNIKYSSSKRGTASRDSKTSHLDRKLKEVTTQGTKLSALLQRLVGQERGNDSNSDRSLSRQRNDPRDSRSLSQGSAGSVGRISDGEVEGLFEDMIETRHSIGKQLKEIIISDPEASVRRGLCDVMWKLGFYQAIEVFRRLAAKRQKMTDILVTSTRNALMLTVSEGIEFYEGFVQDIQLKYNVNFMDLEFRETLLANSLHIYGNPFPTKLTSEQKFVSIVCYQVAINVGDLERYKEVETIQRTKENNSATEISKSEIAKEAAKRFLSARWWYLKAHQLNVKLGKPFHQLAVISQLMKRRLDAVYFHLRNLHSLKPIESGREELQLIFQGVWSRVSADEKKRKLEASKRRDRKMKTFKMSGRIEIWIRPNGKKETMDTSDDEVDENTPEFLSCMDVINLNRKFLLDYLVTIGRLYTKIGMENYKETAVIMLHGLRVLLSSSPIIISEERLYQLLVINIAVIERHAENEAICEEVITLSMDMLGLLCECYFRLIGLLDVSATNGRASPTFGTLKELSMITGAIKVFVNWLVGHAKMWSPQISSLLATFGESKTDLWKYLVEFFNSIGRLSRNLCNFTGSSDSASFIFPEDDFFRGFIPLARGGDMKVDAQKPCLEDKQLVLARISQLKNTIDEFQNLEEPILTFDAEMMKYQVCTIGERKCMAREDNKDLKKPSMNVTNIDDQNDIDQVGGDNDDDDDDDVIVVSSDLISGEESEDETPKEEPTKVISERGLELIVKPKYIVLDTNCLVHNFRNVKILLDSKMFTIVVPLIVIKELEKLEKRGSMQHHPEDKEFNEWLKTQSGLALEFLRKEFKNGNKHLKTATINGTILNSMAFTNEDYTEAQNSLYCNNDDLILVCCTKICQGPGNETLPTNPNDPEKKNRNLVLVTNDRVLRIKAFNDEVPSRNVSKFMQWTGLGKK